MQPMSVSSSKSLKAHVAAIAIFVFASSLCACSTGRQGADQTTNENTANETTIQSDLKERIVITNNRESLQERNRDRNISASLIRMRSSYKLLPDRRFLLAIAEIHQLITGEAKSEIELSYTENGWLINYKGEKVGSLSVFPTGDELFALLKQWSKNLKTTVGPQVISGKSAPPVQVTTLCPSELFKLFSVSNAKDYQTDICKIQTASSAAAWLSIVSIDETGVGDGFYSRALALKACSLSDDSVENIRNECLLADSLQYYAHARKLAAKLPVGDPVRLYLEQDTAGLAKACLGSNKLDQKTFLYLMTLARQRNSAQWLKVLKDHSADSQKMALAVIRTACEFAGEKTQLPVGHYLMVATSRDLRQSSAKKNSAGAPIDFQDIAWSFEKSRESSEWIVGDMAKEFEKSLATVEKSDNAVNTLQQDDYYRAIFATGVYRMATSYLTLNTERNRLAQFSKSIAVKDGPLANLGPWLDYILKLSVSIVDPTDVTNEVTQLRSLGARPLADLIMQAGSFSTLKEPYKLFPACRYLFEFADTRPDTRLALAEIADRGLLYPSISHKLYLASLKDGDSSSVGGRIERAIALRRQDEMVALIKAAFLTENEEMRLLQRMEHLGGVSSAALTGMYRTCAEKHANAWEFVQTYCNHLMETKQNAEATRVLRTFASKGKQANSHELIQAKYQLATIALKEKRYDDGLKDIDKLENTEQSQVLILKARLLEGLNKREDAEAWAEEALKRFPTDPKCISLKAELLWRNGKNAEAAHLLSSRRQHLSVTEWRDYVAPAFARVFDIDSNKMLLAVGSLVDERINSPDTLGQLARAAYVDDHAPEAFGILMRTGQQGIDAGDLFTCAYRYLKRWKGEKSALEWLTAAVGPADRIRLAPYAFLSGQFELLWTLNPQTPDPNETEHLWLMRTAACLVDSDLSKKYKPSLVEHFKKSNQPSADLGKYMLGLSSSYPTTILNDAQRCQYAFYIGWKQLATGEDFFSGTEFYHLALETDRPELHEFRWSQNWLSDLMIMLRQNPAVMESAFYHKIRILGPGKKGGFGEQRRFTINAFN